MIVVSYTFFCLLITLSNYYVMRLTYRLRFSELLYVVVIVIMITIIITKTIRIMVIKVVVNIIVFSLAVVIVIAEHSLKCLSATKR